VTAFEPRVPLLLLDFAYRHTSSILNDALHLSADPYTTHAGARPSATAGAAPMNVSDAAVSANAVQLAIASRLGYQFRGGGGAGTSGGGVSKEWMLELARERNKVSLPRVLPSEWGVRLPNERFVLNGTAWGLKEGWEGGLADDDDDEDEEEEEEDGEGGAMEGVEKTVEDEEDVGGDGVEGGTVDDLFGRDEVMEDDLEAE
jgi:transcription initiation factor TFIID subunit 9B